MDKSFKVFRIYQREEDKASRRSKINREKRKTSPIKLIDNKIKQVSPEKVV